MGKLLIAAVADADVSVRHSIFLSLDDNGTFDEFLAQADSLSSIFVALNDEVISFLIVVYTVTSLCENEGCYAVSLATCSQLYVVVFLCLHQICSNIALRIGDCMVEWSEF